MVSCSVGMRMVSGLVRLVGARSSATRTERFRRAAGRVFAWARRPVTTGTPAARPCGCPPRRRSSLARAAEQAEREQEDVEDVEEDAGGDHDGAFGVGTA